MESKKEVEVTIDGQRAELPEGLTILEAAERVGVEIPHLCHHEWLTPAGICRICLVEADGRLVTACRQPIREGMEIKTQSEELARHRRLILELILSDHRLDCFVCEKDGDCKLQDYAYEWGLTEIRFCGERRREALDERSPFILIDYEKCILCWRCVRACEEVQGRSILGFVGRGFETKIAAPFERALQETECEFCGQCVAVCPTGALIEKPSRFQGRSYKLKTVRTVCPYCGVGCRIVLYVRDGRLVRAKGEEAPPNEGKLCVKGRFGFEFVHSKERLTKPLIRKNGRLVEASWDEALDLVAQKFKELKERYGPESLAVLASSRATNESNYLAQKFARTVLGTNNIDNCARICHAPSVHGLYRAFGSGAMTNSIAEIGGAECLFLIGSNPTEAHPVIGARIRRAVQKGTKLIVADPRDIELAKMADIHLQLRPGTDVALANAIVHHIVKQGLHSEKFIEERTENFEKMWAVVEKYTPEYAEKITGVPARLIREAAEMYAKSEPSMVLYCLGITEHRNGVETVMSVANLALVTGHIGKPSSGVSPIRGQNNVQGACDVAALPEFLPGYQRWEDPEVVKKFEEAWGVKLPPAGQGIFCSWLWEKALAGGVKGVYAIGEDVAMSEPNVDRVRRALSEMEFLVVQELFMTPTAELADVVLPAASFAEVDGTYTNTERRVQRVRKALEPPGEARPDWEIICEISKRMGYPMDYEHPSEIFEEMRKLMPIYGGITYKRLEEGPGLQWPCPTEDHPGTPYLHKGKFTRGKGRFHGIEHQGPAEEPDDEYPFLLTTGRILEQYNVATMTRRTPGLEELAPENFVEVSPKDAERLRLSEGEVVRVVSRRGAVEARVRIRDIKEGVVWMPFHYAESPTNRITNEATDPICGTPEVKACAVRIEKLI